MQIEHVTLAINVLPQQRRIEGQGDYRVAVSADLDQLQFDLDPRYAISSVSVGGETLSPDAYANPDGLLTLTLPEAADAGDTLDVSIAYAGSPHIARNAPWDGGIVWSQSGGQPWIATAFQGEGCDMLWPCIDNSEHRLETIDTLWTVPTGLTATGNGRLVSENDNGDGTTTFHWTARDPSNYGIVLQIGPYELSERMYESRYGNAIPIQFWHLPENKAGARRLVAEMADYLDFFESTIGPYPFWDEKAGVVETPHLGMEHQTINAYGNRYRTEALGYDWLLAHEFAHEWFANQLTHSSINHMWLHEGIGTWMQPLYLGFERGEMFYDAEMFRQRQRMGNRAPLVREDGRIPNEADDALGWTSDIYSKGAWVMHSLRYVVGEDVIFPALTELVYGRDDPEPGNFDVVSRSTEDFREILERRSGQDLYWFFDTYLYHAPLPRLVEEREGTAVTFTWAVEADTPFAMPLEVIVDGEMQVVPMDGGTGTLTLPSANSIVRTDPRNQILMYDPAIDGQPRMRL